MNVYYITYSDKIYISIQAISVIEKSFMKELIL